MKRATNRGFWKDGDEPGTIECEGYVIALTDLAKRPRFFLRHIGEKEWADHRTMHSLWNRVMEAVKV